MRPVGTKLSRDMTARCAFACTTPSPKVMTGNGEGPFDGGYTVDGIEFFGTLAAMKSSLEEEKAKAEVALTTIDEVLKTDKMFHPSGNDSFFAAVSCRFCGGSNDRLSALLLPSTANSN